MSNETNPSDTDYESQKEIKRILGVHAPKLLSFIIYWNQIREWRILEYSEEKPCRVVYTFDAAA